MSIAVIVTDRNTDLLCQQLQAQLPEVIVQQWPNIPSPETVQMAVLWKHPSGITDNMTALEMVVSMGAGMDHIDADKNIPDSIKRERIVTLALQQNMAQYVLQHILSHQRHQQNYSRQQQQKQWQVLEPDQHTSTVGFLGLGQLGAFVADQCVNLGFNTLAWTVRQNHSSHSCFHGEAGLKHVCQHSDYIVVLLPLNEQTEGVINSQTLSWCKKNTVLINVGRGGHVKEIDLLESLSNSGIKQAILDVFDQEPLPNDHPYWTHPKITLTPHSSSRSDVIQTAHKIVSYYQQLDIC